MEVEFGKQGDKRGLKGGNGNGKKETPYISCVGTNPL